MRDALVKYIKEKSLFTKDDKILVAVSGGADSIALCHLLHDIKNKFIIAHCNFTLRGDESEEDERFVKDISHALGVEVFVKRFNTTEEASQRKISIQMAARELRYDWFEELRVTEKCKYIATAHHKNDVLETILLNLTRGTGIAGLHGIKEKKGSIIRPLLFATKEEILEYIQEQNLFYREDSSNASDKYYRNLLRHHVVPELKKINPSIDDSIGLFVEKVNSMEEIFNEEILKFKTNITEQKESSIYLSIAKLKQESGLLIKLYEVIQEFGFNFSQCRDLIETLDSQAGKVFNSTEYLMIKDRSHIIISHNSSFNKSYTIENNSSQLIGDSFVLDYNVVSPNEFKKTQNNKLAQLDYHKLKFPLKLRIWEPGDFFYPLGMKQKKKLSDFFIDLKIPLTEKNKKYVLLSEDKIVWVIGERIDDQFKITPETKEIFKITLR